MSLIGPNNAIASAHIRMRGGLKRASMVAVGTFVVLGGMVMISVRADPSAAIRTLSAWTQGLLMLQLGVLGIFATMRVSTTVRQDVQSRLIESHRIMPMSPADAIAGYVLGPTSATLIFATAIFCLGIATAQGAGYSIAQWALANGIGLIVAMYVWILAAYAAITSRGGPAMLVIPIFIMPSIIGSGWLTAVPAPSVILSPVLSGNIFDIRTFAGSVPSTLAVGLAVGGAFSAVFFFAAARKYRTEGAIGIDTLLGLALLALWVGTTLVGMRDWQDFQPRLGRRYDAPPDVQIIASISGGMLIALATISAIAWEHVLWRRHEIARDPAPMEPPLPVTLIILLSTFGLLFIPFGQRGVFLPDMLHMVQSAIVVGITLAGCYFLFAFLYSSYPRASIPMSIWLVLSWGVPVLIDAMRYALMESDEPSPVGGIASCSPVGALIVIWHHSLSPLPGMAMMLAINAIPLSLWLTLQARRRAKRRQITNATDSHTPS